MNLQLQQQLIVVCGASAGLGRATAEALLAEGAHVVAVARRAEALHTLQEKFPGQTTLCVADLTQPEAVATLLRAIGSRQVHGLLLNAGGPPAKAALETTLADWDAAYQNVLRWKIACTQALLPGMMQSGYGRVLLVESISVKQPVPNLVLSNALRMAAVGFAKTLSAEVGSHGITINVLAPGYHQTDALQRVVHKRMSQTPGSDEVAISGQFAGETSVKRLGTAEEFGQLACWLLSPLSSYITGQTISHDGGLMKGVMG